MSEALLWVDVETTGLCPGEHRLLEVAMQPTTFDSDFTEIGDPFHVIVYHGRDLRLQDVSPDVLRMHSENGLWRESRGGQQLDQAFLRLMGQVNQWRARSDWEIDTFYLAGRSVHFDRKWLEAYVPDDVWVRVPLSHRHFDLTTIKAWMNITGLPFDVPEETHRALRDVLDDIELARSLAKVTTLQ